MHSNKVLHYKEYCQAKWALLWNAILRKNAQDGKQMDVQMNSATRNPLDLILARSPSTSRRHATQLNPWSSVHAFFATFSEILWLSRQRISCVFHEKCRSPKGMKAYFIFSGHEPPHKTDDMVARAEANITYAKWYEQISLSKIRKSGLKSL